MHILGTSPSPHQYMTQNEAFFRIKHHQTIAFKGRKERTKTHCRRSNFRPLKSSKGLSMYLIEGSEGR